MWTWFGLGDKKPKDCSERLLKYIALCETVKMLPVLIPHAWIKLQTVYLKFYNALITEKLRQTRGY